MFDTDINFGMKNSIQHTGVITWIARILTFLFAGFLSIFSLDVFSEAKGILDTAIDLFMHMIPSILLLLALIIAWRWEKIGSIIYLGVGIFYIFETWGKIHWSGIVLIASPVFIIAILFAVSGFQKIKVKQD